MGGISYDVLTKTPGIDNLNIITAGSNVPHPAELISTDAVNNLLKELRTRYDYIILDSAPVLPVTDVLILGQKANTVLLVYKAGRTAKSALMRTVDQLKNANINVKGIILNHISPEIDISPNYYYHYYRNYPSTEHKED
jgi:capsular exopolysaccharide synthesis family protein